MWFILGCEWQISEFLFENAETTADELIIFLFTFFFLCSQENKSAKGNRRLGDSGQSSHGARVQECSGYTKMSPIQRRATKSPEYLSYDEWLRELGLLSRDKRRLGRDPINMYLKRRWKEGGGRNILEVPNVRIRDCAQTETQEVLSKHQQTLLYFVWQRIAQQGDGFFLLGDPQKPLGHGREQPAQCGPGWARG